MEQQIATARRQQTDGQAEKAVDVVKTMIRTYLGAKKEDWLRALPLLEFTHNSTPHPVTGVSPHMMTYGTELKGLDAFRQSTRLDEIDKIISKARKALLEAQTKQAENYNRKRTDVRFAKGDSVLIKRDAIATFPEMAQKYRAPFIGPYEILEVDVTKDNYKLALPPNMRLHPVFHVSALRQYRRPDANRSINRPNPTENDEYEIEKIIDTRIKEINDSTCGLRRVRSYMGKRRQFRKCQGSGGRIPRHQERTLTQLGVGKAKPPARRQLVPQVARHAAGHDVPAFRPSGRLKFSRAVQLRVREKEQLVIAHRPAHPEPRQQELAARHRGLLHAKAEHQPTGIIVNVNPRLPKMQQETRKQDFRQQAQNRDLDREKSFETIV